MFFNTSFPAKALAYAILVSVFVAIISLALIKYAEINIFESTERAEQERLSRNLHSGINIVLNSIQNIEPRVIDLFDNKTDSIMITKYKWGGFDIGIVKSITNSLILKDSIQKAFLIGVEKTPISDFALVCPKINSYLSLANNTLIVGNCVIPKAGIKGVTVSPWIYTRSKCIYGQEFKESNSLPAIDKKIVEGILHLYTHKAVKNSTLPQLINNSFLSEPLFIEGDSLYLDHIKIVGKVIIKSPNSITVGRNCELTDVILIAPKIHFKAGFQGQLQAFAMEQLITENDTRFYYPSILGVIESPHKKERIKILHLGKQSLLEGWVMSSFDNVNTTKTYISIQEGAVVHGCVWSDIGSSLELKGSVYGNVLAHSFYYSNGITTLDNTIVNGTIDISQLSNHYKNPPFLIGDKKYSLLNWLY